MAGTEKSSLAPGEGEVGCRLKEPAKGTFAPSHLERRGSVSSISWLSPSPSSQPDPVFGERHKGKSEARGAGAEAIMVDMMARTRATAYLSRKVFLLYRWEMGE